MMATKPVDGVGLPAYREAWREGQITEESVLWVTAEGLRGPTFLYTQ